MRFELAKKVLSNFIFKIGFMVNELLCSLANFKLLTKVFFREFPWQVIVKKKKEDTTIQDSKRININLSVSLFHLKNQFPNNITKIFSTYFFFFFFWIFLLYWFQLICCWKFRINVLFDFLNLNNTCITLEA